MRSSNQEAVIKAAVAQVQPVIDELTRTAKAQTEQLLDRIASLQGQVDQLQAALCPPAPSAYTAEASR